ncbi:MAG TPA: hypothetical protein VLB06_03595 [Sulfuricaulis sp.]|nr:hypothetical protein [Sulfuricaulis sp.]
MAFSPGGTRAIVEQVLRVVLLLFLGFDYSVQPPIGRRADFLCQHFAAIRNTCQVTFSDKSSPGNSEITEEQRLGW